MPKNFFVSKAGSHGVELVHTGFTSFGTVTLTANTTNYIFIPVPARACRLGKLTVCVNTVPADADGTLVATAKKYVSGSSNSSMNSSTVNMEGLTTKVPTKFTITATEVQRLFNQTGTPTDMLVIEVVSNSAAIDTQPTDVSFDAEWEILR